MSLFVISIIASIHSKIGPNHEKQLLMCCKQSMQRGANTIKKAGRNHILTYDALEAEADEPASGLNFS